MTTVAFIGLGNMGLPMAANLTAAGHTVRGFDVVTDNLTAAAAKSVTPATTAVDAVSEAEVVITMLPAGEHVRSVWGEIVSAAASGALMIDCSTIDVD
ncbi:MAG: NAD(P)-binding domain-containing protein, partial [Pseudomonadota bacterium]